MMTSSQPPPSSQKKQKSISSFFTPKDGSASKPPLPRQASRGLFVSDEDNAPAADNAGNTLKAKRSVDAVEEGPIEPQPKRRKESPAADLNGHRASLGTVSVNSSRERSKVTATTSKYAFSGSLSGPDDENLQGEDEREDEEIRRIKAALHEKFVKKLGRPDSMMNAKRRNALVTEETPVEEAEDEDEEEDHEDTPPPRRGKKEPANKKSKGKLTPGEQQIVDLKRKHPDALLVVETGYKYRLWGEDARVAAKVLSIMCIPGKYRFDEHPSEAHLTRFASASFPTHRLHVHVKRLVSAGHKVGIVRQLETAALKAAGSNRSKLFERGLTNLYTKGTYIDDEEGVDAAAAGDGTTATGHLLCLTETYPKGIGSDEKVQIGMVAVQPSTGDIIYDDFEDGWMRGELETRLLHISPCEFLIVGDLSKATQKLVEHLSGGDDARMEHVEKPKTMVAQAYSHITKFYADQMKEGDDLSQVRSSQETGTLLDKVHKLSDNATVCLSAMITHLTDYGLQHVFDLTKCFQSFSARSHMLLNGNTLTSLEIYRNQTDQSERGSLFWTLNHTHTRFGRRLLRKWVGRPLVDRVRLDERVAAVEELRDGVGKEGVERLRRLLKKIRSDLEKTLIRIYYKKCTRPELLALLQTLQLIAHEYAHVSSPSEAGFASGLISEAIAALPRIADDVLNYLDRLNAEAARQDDKYNFFREAHETEDMNDHKGGIVAVEHELNEFRQSAAATLKRPQVTYVTSAEIDYLIELPNTSLKNVPASWIKVSGTKKVSRYHAPEVVRLIRERDQHKEALSNACDTAFLALLTEIGSQYQAFRDCVQALAQLDCLLSLAEVAQQPGYCKPTFQAEPGIDIVAGRHPMVEQLVLDEFVPNDARLSPEGTRALLITGPNMGGKSSYVRSVALIAIMAQIGSYVPAEKAELGLLDAVFTRMGAFDNMLKGESTFRVELGETSDILKQATPRSLVILDELGRGTSTHDGVAIAHAVLQHMTETVRAFTLFITHYQSLARLVEQFPDGALQNVHMRFTEQDSATTHGEKDLTFLYRVGEGVAHRSYGLNVARLAGLPRSLLEEASRRSKSLEEEEARRRLSFLALTTRDLFVGSDGSDAVRRLLGAVDMS